MDNRVYTELAILELTVVPNPSNLILNTILDGSVISIYRTSYGIGYYRRRSYTLRG